jgi:ATP-dependent Clp endopeptidase proteolytic subunit ClpP
MNGRRKEVDKNNDTVNVDDMIDTGFLQNQIHFINGVINEENVGKAIRWIIFENIKNDDAFLTLYINSEGGSLPDAFALIDVMRMSKKPVRTIGIGSICSSAFLIFSAGSKGYRSIGRNTTIMCHQFSDSVEGKYHDLQTRIKENKRMNDRMIDLLTEVSELDSKTVKTKLLAPSDIWLSANEVLELGIADSIL